MNNVAPKDLAILVHPTYPENQDKICTVVQQIPNTDVHKGKGVVWFCTFPSSVKTEQGMHPFASLFDWQLRRIAGPSLNLSIQEVKELFAPADKCGVTV